MELIQCNGWLMCISKLDDITWKCDTVQHKGSPMELDSIVAFSRTSIHKLAKDFAMNVAYHPGLGWRL